MPWTAMPTFSGGAALTAAQLNVLVSNLNETAPGKATAAGRIFVSTGANAVAERVPSVARVTGASQSTTSASLTDLGTVGPTVTVTTGTQAIIALGAFVANSTAGQGGYMAYEVSGSSSISATVNRALRLVSSNANENFKASYVTMQTGLTSGSNTFTAKYSVIVSGTATFDEREMVVIPL